MSRLCRQGARGAVGLVLVSLAVTGCAHNHEALERQLAELRDELAELKRTDRSVTVRLEDVENRVLLVQDRVETRQTFLYRDRPQEGLPTVRLAPPGSRSRVPPSPTPIAIEPAAPSRGAEPFAYAELDPYGRVVSLGEPVETPTTLSPDPTPITVAPGPVAPSSTSESRELSPREERRATGDYKRAFRLTRRGRYKKALARFERFVERYPGHPLADNAVYWMAECHYAQKSYLEALQLFQRVIRDYPDGNKVPDAMLKTGLCYGNLGEVEQARRVLRQVAVIYPGSRAADIARERERSLRSL